MAGGAATSLQQVVANNEPLAVHEINTDRVVVKAIVFGNSVVAVHEVKAISSRMDGVFTNLNVIRIPNQQIARLANGVADDPGSVAVPNLDAVAPDAHFDILTDDGVSLDQQIVRERRVDAEQGVEHLIVENADPLSLDVDRAVFLVEIASAVLDREAFNRDIGRFDANNGALVVSVDHRRVDTDQVNRLIDDERTSVVTAPNLDRGSGGCDSERRLDRTVFARFAHHERSRRRFARLRLRRHGSNEHERRKGHKQQKNNYRKRQTIRPSPAHLEASLLPLIRRPSMPASASNAPASAVNQPGPNIAVVEN